VFQHTRQQEIRMKSLHPVIIVTVFLVAACASSPRASSGNPSPSVAPRDTTTIPDTATTPRDTSTLQLRETLRR